MSLSDIPDIIARVEGAVGRLTLNRPRALHSVTEPMCRALTDALLAWREDPAVALVLIDHAGERGFCAGGDIRMMAQAGANDPAAGAAFFLAEYRMNDLLQRYPKPVVAVMDGVTMGGGVGLSAYCRYRISTERTVLAMPETGIGLFPDIGAGWLLARLPGDVGTWMALTGARLKAADGLHLGLCTHYVESREIDALKARLLASPAQADAVLEAFATDPGPALLPARQAEIDRLFAGDTVETIVAALEGGSDWARAEAQVLAAKSPTSMKVSLRQLRTAAGRPAFADEMVLEYRLACRLIAAHDFQEGVRAVVVDKDNQPRWSPARLEDVTEAVLDRLFAPFDDQPEWTPLP